MNSADYRSLSDAKCPKWLSGFTGCCLLVVLNLSVQAQQTFSYSQFSIKHRITFGPAFSFFKNHPKMTVDTKAKVGFNAAYKMELFLGRRTNLLAGLEYMTQGLTFRGYYDAPGYTYVFDESFAYTHEIRFSDISSALTM
jgi:hypothetical protein